MQYEDNKKRNSDVNWNPRCHKNNEVYGMSFQLPTSAALMKKIYEQKFILMHLIDAVTSCLPFTIFGVKIMQNKCTSAYRTP